MENKKNRTEDRTETEKNKKLKRNRTEFKKMNQTKIIWFDFSFNGLETEPKRTQYVLILFIY